MVMTYDVTSSRWSSHFWVKIHVFSTSFNNKSKSYGYNHAKCLVMCYFSCKTQKIYHFSWSWWRPWSRPLLVTPQASSSATTHKTYFILLSRSKAFNYRQNLFEILQHIRNPGEGFHPPPSAPPCTTVGVWVCVYVRGLIAKLISKT